MVGYHEPCILQIHHVADAKVEQRTVVVRTSETDPVEVDFLSEGLAGMPGRLGITFAPGKSGPSHLGEKWDRDLMADAERLTGSHGTDVLVTLVEAEELGKLDIPKLFDEMTARGVDVYWYPIRQGNTPGERRAVDALVDHVLSRVYNGETVVVHCTGGLGRSGTIVGCCLRALEYEPERCFEIVRKARDGAIENRAQESYVTNYDNVWAAGMSCVVHTAWRHIEKLDKTDGVEPREYDVEILSDDLADDPDVRFIPAAEPEEPVSSEPTGEPDSDEAKLVKTLARLVETESARQFVGESRVEELIDRAASNKSVDTDPIPALTALRVLCKEADPYRTYWKLYSTVRLDLPHLRNAARRLAIPASRAEIPAELRSEGEYGSCEAALQAEFDCSLVELRSRLRAQARGGHPLDFYDGDPDNFDQFLDFHALRFDGYAYRDRQDFDPTAMLIVLEQTADYARYHEFELQTGFFLLQRYLRKWGGERCPREAASRRVYRELFLRLWNADIPERWARGPTERDRPGIRRIAPIFLAAARRHLRERDYEGPCRPI